MRGPGGFVPLSEGGAEMVLRADVAASLVAGGIGDPEGLRGAAAATYRGRGRPFGVEVAGAGRVFVRPYLHGGAFGRITGDRFASDARFAAELAAHVDAAAAGVPVCEALGVVSRGAGLGMRRGWLLLREIDGARDLLETLCARPESRRRRALLAKAGRAIRALHDAGFEHPDLHLKNLLVRRGTPGTPAPSTGPDTPDAAPRAGGAADADDDAVLVLDLDAVRRRPSLDRERRLAGLFRFDRYAAKQAAAGHPVTRTDRLRVLRAYAGDAWPARDELRALAARLRSHIARHAAVRSRAAEVTA